MPWDDVSDLPTIRTGSELHKREQKPPASIAERQGRHLKLHSTLLKDILTSIPLISRTFPFGSTAVSRLPRWPARAGHVIGSIKEL